mmetsp:Transcript_55806/g.122246  ORF Transcript_55806/g.122246 Transcript_55806/m.122246 type:complete len:312 (+) Transcript_55806:74-1009(+)
MMQYGGQAPTKLFLGGLTNSTTKEMLREHFSRYGEITDCVVMFKNDRPRGFGFVTFLYPDSADQVLSQREQQIIDGRLIDVKSAVPKAAPQPYSEPTKLFVGGLTQRVDGLMLRNYFATYGSIVDAVVMMDKATQRSRGFGFVRFSTGSEVDAVMRDVDHHTIDGKWIEVKRAVPQDSVDEGEGGKGGLWHERGGAGPMGMPDWDYDPSGYGMDPQAWQEAMMAAFYGMPPGGYEESGDMAGYYGSGGYGDPQAMPPGIGDHGSGDYEDHYARYYAEMMEQFKMTGDPTAAWGYGGGGRGSKGRGKQRKGF